MRALLITLFVAGGIAGQVPSFLNSDYPVTVSVLSVKGIPDGAFDVLIRAQMTRGHHIYSLIPEEAPNAYPTTIGVTGSKRVALRGEVTPDRPAEMHSVGGVADAYWENRVTFTIPLTLKDPVPGEEIEFNITVDHMVCNDQGCLAPKTLDVSAKITVTAEGLVEAAAAGETESSQTPTEEEESVTEIPTEFDETEVDEEIATATDLHARLEPSNPAPGDLVNLIVPLPEYTAEVGTKVMPSEIILFTSQVDVTTEPGVVRGTDEELEFVIPVRLNENLQNKDALEIAGLLQFEKEVLNFEAQDTVRQGMWGFIWVAILAGFFALLTPCVFPMIPITVSFFTKHSEQNSGSPVVPALVYCAGIVISFTAIGVILASVFGAGASVIAQNPWVLAGIGVLFIFFALSLFGMFELRLPAMVTNLTSSAQNKGGLLGIWLLGLLFAVTSFACTAPFVGTLLTTAIASGEWLRPVVGMAAFAAVLALPFFFLALFPSRLKSMPRSGGWMNEVKVVMGFVELAAAFKFLGDAGQIVGSGVLTRTAVIAVWIALFILTTIYLLGLFRMPHDSPRTHTPVIALMLAVGFFWFATYLSKGLGGEPLHDAIDAFLPRESVERTPVGKQEALLRAMKRRFGLGADSRLGFENHFKNDYEAARAEAKRVRAPLFLDFTGYS